MLPRMVRLSNYAAFKAAITKAVEQRGSTRGTLAREMEAKGILAELAKAAGFDLALTPRDER
jgi:hypothetical protein